MSPCVAVIGRERAKAVSTNAQDYSLASGHKRFLMPLWTTTSAIPTSSSWARGLALCNMAALVGNIVAIIYLNRFRELALCPDVQIGSAILSVLALLGHLSITAWLTYSAVKFNSYPPPFDQMPLSTSLRTPIPTQSGGLTESLIATSNSLNSGPQESDDLKIDPPKMCCSRQPNRALAITVLAISFFPVFLIYLVSSAMAWVRGTTISDGNASLQLDGLLHDTLVSRAEKGVVRIEATNEHDLYFTQGAAHAATRLWQMEFQRRVGAGRLAEAVGEGGIEIDKLFRTLGVYSAAERDYNYLDEDTKNTIQAYCDGVNSYINKAVNSGQHYLPIEFVALGFKPDTWRPADSLVWSKIMSWDLSLNLNDEYQRYRWLVTKNITKERINVLKPPYDLSRFPTVLSDDDIAANLLTEPMQSNSFAASMLSDGMEAALLRLFKEHSSHKADRQHASPTPPIKHENHQVFTSTISLIFSSLRFVGHSFRSVFGHATNEPCASTATTSATPRGTLRKNTKIGASNNWVVHGNRTLSGKPLLCNDPHLQLLSPSIWQLTHLDCPSCQPSGLETIGASFIGLPGIVIGRNNHIAWGVTNTGADVQDLYILTEKDGDSSSYLFDGEYLPYNITSTVIKVKGGKDIPFIVRSSRFGPVITDNDVYDSLGGPPLSLRWVSIDPLIADTTFSSFRCLNRAVNYTQFRECLSSYIAPSQNFIFADTEGDIGYQMPGWIPLRHPDHSGAYPVPGDTSQFDWQEKVPFDDLPRTLNPPEGFIVSANNRVTPPSYKYNLTVDWDSGSDGYRAKRITQMIQETPLLTPDDMARIQTDYTSLAQRDLAQALYNVSDSLFREGGGGLAIRNLLFRFDGRLIVGSQMATLWADVLGQLSQLANAEIGTWVNIVFLLNALESDAAGSSDPACLALSFSSCAAFAANALDTVADMRGVSEAGDLKGVPAWGIDIHKLNIEHAVLSASPLACVADRIEAHGGDEFTINVGGYSGEKYAQDHGPSYRQIVDLASPDASRFVHPMGVDGAPFSFDDGSDGVSAFAPSGSYDDLLPLWLNGDYVPMSMSSPPDTSKLTMRFSP